MNDVLQMAVHRKNVCAIYVAYMTDGHEFAGRFSVPPTDGARASTP
jgi:hypothetical protein